MNLSSYILRLLKAVCKREKSITIMTNRKVIGIQQTYIQLGGGYDISYYSSFQMVRLNLFI